MSTRSYITVKLKKEDIGTTRRVKYLDYPYKVIPRDLKTYESEYLKDFLLDGINIKLEKNYIRVYCHFDGYMKGGVGENLFRYFGTYEKALGLCLLGDLSSIDVYDVVPYFEGKTLQECSLQLDILPEFDPGIDCVYLFEDEVWKYKTGPNEFEPINAEDFI